MTKFYNTAKLLSLTATCMIASLATKAQGITISKRSSLVANGNVSLVINNGSFNNNGSFAASTSTVKFSGHVDTLTAFVGGVKRTIFHNLSVTKSNYGVALKAAVAVQNVLAVQGGNLYTDSNLTLLSDAALTARVAEVPASSHIIGKTNVERFIPARRAWHLMTAPVTNANSIFNSWQNKGVYTEGQGMLVTGPNPTATNGLDVSYQNNISMKGWDVATQNYTNVTNTHNCISRSNTGSADNLGYFVFTRGDRNPSNTNVTFCNSTTITSIGELQTGAQTFTAGSRPRQFTLIGNPYASPVDFNNITRSNLVKRFYVWDPKLNTNGGYVMLDDLDNDGVYTKSVGASKQTKDIQSSQAFFVETKANGAATVSFSETAKSGNNNNLVFRPETATGSQGTGIGQISASLNLVEADNSTILADGALVEFDTLYSATIDSDDALKFGNVNESIAIVAGASGLAAERRPALSVNDTVFIKLSKLVQRNYEFEFAAAGLQEPTIIGLLEDNFLKTTTIISLDGVTRINFNVTSATGSAAANRFRIVFKQVGTVLPVSITNVAAYQKNNNIAVEWKVSNEINMVKYEIEKSVNGTTFNTAGIVEVKGTNNATNSYSFLDVHAVVGNNFFRIKAYDLSGKISYSVIVKVAMGTSTKEAGFSIYPNPVTTNNINLVLTNQAAGNYQVIITNTVGQVMQATTVNSNGGNSTQTINTGSKMAAGIYQIELIGKDNSRSTQKLIVQ